jgi:outer membrane protein OmpA-like peptidoglycan-associated protein
MATFKTYLLSFLLLCSATAVLAQGSEKKTLKQARKELAADEFEKAKVTYDKLLSINGQKSDYFFEAGLAWFRSDVQKEKSIYYFENALKTTKKDTVTEVYYYLAQAYHYAHQFDKAIYYYNAFRPHIDNSADGIELTKEINRKIEMCNSGIALLQTENKKIEVTNAGYKINTPFAEYAPIVNQKEDVLIFTSRKRGSTGEKEFYDAKYYEDIYVTHKEDSLNWAYSTKFDSAGVYVSSKVNTKSHDAAIGFNADETKLYIYRDRDVWQSEKIDGVWTDPVRMNRNINSSGHEPSVFITPDEKTLYLVSTRAGGFGGRDIYVSRKQDDGSWGAPENLGVDINTMYDEDAPYLSKDGKTFYFSSQGHNSMGGYDVFKCEIGPDGKLGKPVNVGMPINTAGDDIYLLVDQWNTVAYYASSRMGGFGDMDIYRIQLDCRNVPNTEVRGVVLAGDKQLPTGARIRIVEKESGKEIGVYTADKYTGKYTLILPPSNTYTLFLEVDGFDADRAHTEDFTIPKQCEVFPMFQEINVRRYRDTTRKQLAQEAHFRNAMFDVKKEALKEFNITGLPEDGWNLNAPSPNHTHAIGGRLMHNDIVPGKNITVFLVNQAGEIIQTTSTNASGVFQFRYVKPGEQYTVLIDETDSKLSYFGDAVSAATGEVTMNGYLEMTNMTDRTTVVAPNIPVKLANESKKIVNLTTSDKNGKFSFVPREKMLKEITEDNLANTYIYKIQIGDADQLFSSFIRTIDPNNTELYYSEFVDIIYLEKMMKEIPNFENIYFDFDRYFLRPKSIEVLDKIAAFMLANPEVTIDIAGHCDHKGTDEYNVALSEKRAKAAYDYLFKKGIQASRMKKSWFGESQPAKPNTNADGTDNPDNRQANRRVVFDVDVPGMANVTLSM